MAVTRNYKTIELDIIVGNKLPKSFLEAKHIIESFIVRDDDIWLASYPKSGTTWAQELIWLVANDLDYEGAKQTIERRFPFLEYSAINGKERARFLVDNNLKSNFPKCAQVPEYMKKFYITEKRFIKTHLNWDLLPKQIRDGLKTPKIIYILRNPKQVAVSYYHHATKVFPWFIGDLTDFVELFMKGEVLFGDYFANILPFWQRTSMPNLLIITFEEMKKDLRSVIRKVADFLGKSLTDGEIQKLEVHLSFEQMKLNNAVNKQHMIKNKSVEFLRKGTVDSFKEELNEEVIHKLDEWIQDNAQGSGLPYEIKM